MLYVTPLVGLAVQVSRMPCELSVGHARRSVDCQDCPAAGAHDGSAHVKLLAGDQVDWA